MSLLRVKCVSTLRNVMAVINESFLCKYKFYIKNFQFIPSLLFVLGQEASPDPYGESWEGKSKFRGVFSNYWMRLSIYLEVTNVNSF